MSDADPTALDLFLSGANKACFWLFVWVPPVLAFGILAPPPHSEPNIRSVLAALFTGAVLVLASLLLASAEFKRGGKKKWIYQSVPALIALAWWIFVGAGV